ncbi:MAG: alpha-hydroxy-acid oxidizing protein [Acetobacteraceae bacterium]
MAETAGNDFQTLHEIVKAAHAALDRNMWDYVVGATETETTMRRNRLALDRIALRPRGAARRVGHRCVGDVFRQARAASGGAGGRSAGWNRSARAAA